MAGGQDAVETGGHDMSEAEALLNDTRLCTTDDALSVSTAGMGARKNAPRLSHKPIADTPDGGIELPHQDPDSANLRAQGHEAALQRSFSPLAALGLGFRYSIVLSFREVFLTDWLCLVLPTLGSDT